MSDHGAPVKAALDAGAVLALLGWATNVLPLFATILTVVWTGLRCYEAVLVIRQKKAELAAFEKQQPPPT